MNEIADDGISIDYINALYPKVMHESILLGDDNFNKNWTEKTLRMIARAARKSNQLDILLEIITSQSTTNCCVVFNDKLPSSYGRVMLLSLKLFRYPWIKYDFQVKPTAFCRNPYKRRQIKACINPWHYRSLDFPTPRLPPVVINRSLDFGALPNIDRRQLEDDDDEDSDEWRESTEAPDDDSKWNSGKIQNVTLHGDEIRIRYEQEYRKSKKNATSPQPPTPTSPESPMICHRKEDFRSTMSSPASGAGESPPTFIGDQQLNDIEMADVQEESNRAGTFIPMNSNGMYQCVEFEEANNWLSLSYYEESKAVSENSSFYGTHLLVDGFVSPFTISNRFSIGYFSNHERSDKVREIRQMVGRGCRFYYLGGEVYLESLCEAPIFVQSVSANIRHGFTLATVMKLPPFCSMKVFDHKQFADQMNKAAEKSFQDVYALSKMCTIRVSFVKGWGYHYKRTSITRAPVWIQAHLNGPLDWIDKVLKCMGAPPTICSSRT